MLRLRQPVCSDYCYMSEGGWRTPECEIYKSRCAKYVHTEGGTKDSADLAPLGSPAARGLPWCYRLHRLDLRIPVLGILLIGDDRGQKLNVIRAVNPLQSTIISRF